ncbi:MAG: efflux RND transporter periplasmic adaptor subunit [Candidatus Caenarcaniphilales bacterium]|nr:efflux RND transporter periplasmic adaptor subunit [Candidatus Caenarcaniphilales bacterium]
MSNNPGNYSNNPQNNPYEGSPNPFSPPLASGGYSNPGGQPTVPFPQGQPSVPQQPIQAGVAQHNVSKSDLKTASKQIMTNVPVKKPAAEQKGPQAKASSKPKNPRKMIFFVLFLLALFIPMPKQVGGDIEVSGAPSINQAILRPSVSGTLQEIRVKTNQEVKAGEVIAVLRNWEIEEKILEGEKQLSRLRAAKGSLNAQVKIAEEEYNRAKEEYNRQSAESNFIQSQAKALEKTDGDGGAPRIESTRKQLQQIRLQAESLSQRAALHKYLSDEGVYPRQSALQSAYEAASAEKQADALSSQLKAEESELKQKSVEDVPKLKEALKGADANLRRLEASKQDSIVNDTQIADAQKQLAIYKKQKDELVLKSPIDGTVLTLKTDLLLGQNFNRGDTVAIVGNLSEVKVNLQLPEEDRAYVQEGQKVTARIRARPDEVFVGAVQDIAPITSETGEQTNKRRIWDIGMGLGNPQGTLRPGMTGYAKIHTGQWRPFILLAWDEIYKSFRLDRYMDKNPLAGLSPKGAV